MNGIGPLVRQWVHERNDARRASRTGEGAAPAPETPAPTTGIEETAASGATATTTTVKTPSVDSATFTPEALARFEAWKVRHGATAPITTPEPMTAAILAADPVDPIFLPSTDTTNGEPA